MIQETIDRLKAQVPMLKFVSGAASFQQASQSNPPAVPAAYVILFGEQAGPNRLADMQVMQQVKATVGICLVTRSVVDARGAEASNDMDELRKEVKSALFGWAPAEGKDPYERGAGGLLLFRDTHMWWKDDFVTAYIDRSEA